MNKKQFVVSLIVAVLVAVGMFFVLTCADPAVAEVADPVAAATPMIDLTFIVKAVITLCFMLVTVKLIPWIKSKTTDAQQQKLKALYKTLIYAAEQLYGAGNGEAKLDYVIKELEKLGFTADRNEIEATVWEYLNSSKNIN